IAVAEVAGRSVVAGALIVVRIQLDEAVPSVAKKVQRQQPHLRRQFLLHVLDEGRATIVVHHGSCGDGASTSGARGLHGFTAAEQFNFRPQGGNALLAGGVLPSSKVVHQPKKDEGKDNDEECGDGSKTSRHTYSKFGS